MDERVVIFIDGSNFYHALKDNCGRADVNFGDFAKKLCGGRPLERIYYYNVLQDAGQRPEGHRDQQEFLDALRRVPYLEIRLGGTKLSQGVTVEKGIDIMLATDLLNFAWKDVYDAAIVVSGDSDFAYALHTVKDMGKHLEVAYFESNVSKDLVELADMRHIMDREYFKGMWSGGYTGGGGRRRPQRRRRGGQQPPAQGEQRSQTVNHSSEGSVTTTPQLPMVPPVPLPPSPIEPTSPV